MKINNLLIHLQNSVDAFSLKPRHAERIRQIIPETEIVITEGTQDFLEKLPEADCALVWHFKAKWYNNAPRLKTLFTPAAGHDWVAEDPSGRVSTYFGKFHGRIMRESLLSMMLYFNRQVGKSLTDQRDKVWGRLGYNESVALFSQKVLIIGYGSLGHSIAELLKAVGSGVVGVKRNSAGCEGICSADKIISFDRLEEELPHADHVVLLLPGGTKTDGIFTERYFNMMKPGAYLYNLGRGNCYREEDLIDALINGPLAGAGLDVFSEEPLPPTSPLWELPNVLITPHSSAISREYIDLFLLELAVRLQDI